MAVTTTLNTVDTGGGTATTRNARIGLRNWSSDWVEIEGRKSANTVLLRNVGSPMSAQHLLRFERTMIPNIYDGSNILANYQLPTKRGVKLFVQDSIVASVRDDSDPLFEAQLPIVANLTLRVPIAATSFLSNDQINYVLTSLVGATLPSSGNDTLAGPQTWSGCVVNMLNGSINPLKW